MQQNFKFIKTKDNRFIWESDYMILEYSEPTIQPFCSFVKVKDMGDIIYHYYTVKIYRKEETYNNNIQNVLVCKRRVYDFPCIEQLIDIISFQLNDNTTKDGFITGFKTIYKDGYIKYSKTLKTEGFACDDFYEITKTVDKNNQNDTYTVYIGTSFNINGDLSSSGIRTPYISRDDLKELLKCANEFIKHTIDEYNKSLQKYKNIFYTEGDKLYEYSIEKGEVNYNKLESIYIIGDKIDDIYIDKNDSQIEYNDTTIININKNNIKLNNNIIIPISEIRYISDNQYDKVSYNIDEIVNDFYNILSDKEKEEFKIQTTDFLYNKYYCCIINRTNMCRDEHNFQFNSNEDRPIQLKTIIKNIINNIKNKIN